MCVVFRADEITPCVRPAPCLHCRAVRTRRHQQVQHGGGQLARPWLLQERAGFVSHGGDERVSLGENQSEGAENLNPGPKREMTKLAIVEVLFYLFPLSSYLPLFRVRKTLSVCRRPSSFVVFDMYATASWRRRGTSHTSPRVPQCERYPLRWCGRTFSPHRPSTRDELPQLGYGTVQPRELRINRPRSTNFSTTPKPC